MKNQEKKEAKHSEEIENYEGYSEGFNQQGYQEMYQDYPKLNSDQHQENSCQEVEESYEGQSEGFNQQGYQEMYQNYPKLKREKVERGKKITDDSKTKKG